jgi:hypothetical protein
VGDFQVATSGGFWVATRGPRVITYQVSDDAVRRLWTAGIGRHGEQIPSIVFNNLLLFREIYTKKDVADLISAAAEGKTQRVESLINNKIKNVNVKEDTQGLTALMKAGMNGHKQTVDLLIARGADVNIEDNCGKNALWWAEFCKATEIVQLLRDKGSV